MVKILRNNYIKLCNCGCILEDIGKEWFLPTYIGLLTRKLAAVRLSRMGS